MENFFLGDDFIDAVAGSSGRIDELRATMAAMREVGIDRAPYPDFFITTSEKATDKVSRFLGAISIDDWEPSPSSVMRFGFKNYTKSIFEVYEGNNTLEFINGNVSIDVFGNIKERVRAGGDKEILADTLQGLYMVSRYMLHALIIGLVMRGARKERRAEKISKLEKLGIGKKRISKPYNYTTTLSVSSTEQNEENNAASGRSVRPHLRRGYARDQHYGPANQYIKKIFVEPVFVNADVDLPPMSQRERYNVNI